MKLNICDFYITCRPAPRIPETLLSERATRQAIQDGHRRLSRVVETLYYIACGKDIKMFILVRRQSSHFTVPLFPTTATAKKI
jgi:hypothetical protein